MNYFEQFPILYYSLDNKAVSAVRDITKRVGLSDELRNAPMLYDDYTITDGETPDIVATNVYGSPQFHWVVMLCNDIVNVDDWPFSQRDLAELIALKYESPNGIHHYENVNGQWVNQGTPLSSPITNYEFETRLNDSKRYIRVLKPQALSPFVDQFKVSISE